MHVLVLRHVAFEDLGAWGPALARRGWRASMADAGPGALSVHDPLVPDLLIVLGGPLAVYESSDYPFIHEEIAFISERLDKGLPTIGVCLGAQLLAAAAGARIYPSGVSEIGFKPIQLTAAGADSCLSPFVDDPMTLHWHGDTFDLPDGARLLASTEAVPNQAFAMGDMILGVQFHPEWGHTAIEPWLIGHTVELRKHGVDINALRADSDRLRLALAAKAERVLDLFLAGCGLEE